MKWAYCLLLNDSGCHSLLLRLLLIMAAAELRMSLSIFYKLGDLRSHYLEWNPVSSCHSSSQVQVIRKRKKKQNKNTSPDQYCVDFDTNNTAVIFRKCKCKFCVSLFLFLLFSVKQQNQMQFSVQEKGVSTNKRKWVISMTLSISPSNLIQSVREPLRVLSVSLAGVWKVFRLLGNSRVLWNKEFISMS